ncbi:tetratricopeptide repeat protein [Geobacter sp. SVR]|uniref:tetratricopeptide repeat protein n=1 Tax=Geobacter sp. SVR TaxID=2495594 RepID=UPI00143EF8C2|nr:tetratricopeptide repeat protein [Geobacter sp. SVR]BCS54314.1 lipoprotein [Geobacter sp. SVR]GCF85827.1 lipoprotein [Geobacter sp. SVR]
MRHELGIVMLFAMLLTGCSTFSGITTMSSSAGEQERNFRAALEQLGNGREKEARLLLERVVGAPPLKGVTDEALFRLALLSLREDGNKGVGRTQALLDQLRNEFPRSMWTYQAAPLVSYLAGSRSARSYQRELKSLRDQNLSLTRDNRELRQTLERLKSLDLELEQKIRR